MEKSETISLINKSENMNKDIKNLRLVRYWGRKPPSMISKYIKEFTNKGELVLDPFGGSGNIIRVALALGRRAIYVDLNPFAKLIAESTILGCSLKKFKNAIETIISEKEIKIKTKKRKIIKVRSKKLFSIKCLCGKSVEVNFISFTRIYIFKFKPNNLTKYQRKVLNIIQKKGPITHESLIKHFSKLSKNAITAALKKLIKSGAIIEKIIPMKVVYIKPCTCGRSKLNNPHNLQWIIKEPIYPIYWYPRTKLSYPNGETFLKKRDVERVHEFFDNRTLAFLSYLWNKIKQINVSSQVRRCLYLTFMSTLVRSSKMNRESGGSWPINSYWIPPNYVIRNPFYVFMRAANDVIRSLSMCRLRLINGSVLKVLKKEADVAFLYDDAMNLPLPANSIDYVITDPPHTDETQFFELSVFYTSWLRKKLDFKKEFIINPKQGKDLKRYFKMYARFVLEVRRVLKPGRYFTVILHEEDESILKKCLEITKNAGFTLYKSDKVNNFHLFTFRSTVGISHC
jgi:DNA modification methylase/DNA-binding MarR family transcriptional regulator